MDILIRSYYRDLSWLRYCLASIRRWCTGFAQVVVVVPTSSLERARHRGIDADRVVTCADYRDDYLGQQITKVNADRFCAADLICHVDSDCIFRRPTRPADLHNGGRPYVLAAPYATLDRHVPWQGLTEQALGIPIEYEFMRRPPYTFPRWLYARVRAHCQARHGRPLDEYILGQPARGFSEFNVLGAFAHAYHREAFDWIDVSRDPTPPAACRVFWSRSGIDQHTRGEIEALLSDGAG